MRYNIIGMLQFIIVNIMMVSLGTILYIVARSLPRIEENESRPQKETFLDRLVMSEIPHRIDTAVNTYTGKLFRKLKISLMRLDNYLTKKLKRMSAEGNGNGKKIDFSGLTASSEEKNASSGAVAENEKKEDNTTV